MERPIETKNFFSDIEVEVLKKFYSTLPKTVNNDGPEKAYTTGFEFNNLPIKKFRSRLKNIFGEFGVATSHFLQEWDPWTIHTEYQPTGTEINSTDITSKPYYAVLFPLCTQNLQTHTVIFNEVQTENGNTWSKDHNDKVKTLNANESSLLDHVDQNELRKVTINKILPWKVGNMIGWHRKYLHSSDNFHNAGIKEKLALVLFLNH